MGECWTDDGFYRKDAINSGMLFQSVKFVIFFTIVFLVYYCPQLRGRGQAQNVWLLLASYVFYAVADLKMLPLLLGVSIVFYYLGEFLGKAIECGNQRRAHVLCVLGIVLGVGLLFVFKYYGFFIESIVGLFSQFGLKMGWPAIHILIPCGVSFYTFRFISYVIEISRERVAPAHDIVSFSLYVSFFPCILSGPIDRPNEFLPQIARPREFDYAMSVDGCRQVLWGAFTKMCVSDNLSALTDAVWSNPTSYSGFVLLFSALLYPIQLYADFSGYSNMSIGIGKLLGLKITRNFDHPFLARNIAEYWQRWHMSLTRWCTDYVFTPLNLCFRSLGNSGTILAVMINFIIIGFWHGANWTYGLFGLYHGLLYIPLILSGVKHRKHRENRLHLPVVSDVSGMLMTYLLVSIGLVIFRAPSVVDVGEYVSRMFSPSLEKSRV